MFNKLTLLLIAFISINSVYADNFGIGNSNSVGFGFGKDVVSSSSSSSISGNCPGGYVVQNISSGVLECVPDQTGAGGGAYNITYQTWSYNQTIPSNLYTDNKIFPIFNSTYQTWSYNQTTPAITYASLYSYNETAICIAYANNQGWNSTYNITYEGAVNNATYQITYNITYNGAINNGSYLAMYNISYEGLISNTTYLSKFNQSYQNLIGQNCPVGKVVNGTLANGTLICTTDQTGAGGGAYNVSYAVVGNCSAGQVIQNITNTGIQCITPTATASPLTAYKITELTTNATGLTFITLFTIPLVAQTNYSIECYIYRSSNVTTSGVRYNMSLAGVPDWMVMSERVYTTATAVQTNTQMGASIYLMPTAVTASLAHPTYLTDDINIYIDGNANTGGDAIFQFSGELAGLLAIIGKGSYCEVESIT